MANVFSKELEVSNFRSGSDLKVLRSKISYIMQIFESAGAEEVEIPALLDSKVLIDLYGEDLRSRAFVTYDPVAGEKILRPDFTVPIAEMHIASERKTAKYSYAGPVWRSQSFGSSRPKEYYQVGVEYFHQGCSTLADADVFSLFLNSVKEFRLEIQVGDMGILRSLVLDLEISDPKKRLLLRHLWRPDRFRNLLKQFSRKNSTSEIYTEYQEALSYNKSKAYICSKGSVIGLRSVEDVEKRMTELLEEDSSKLVSNTAVKIAEEILSLKCPLLGAVDKLSKYVSLGPKYLEAYNNLYNRVEAMNQLGIKLNTLTFATSFGRSSLEYYDGFIFSMNLKNRPELPPIVLGGRYDELTKVLSKGLQLPAVGGVVRPEVLSFSGGTHK